MTRSRKSKFKAFSDQASYESPYLHVTLPASVHEAENRALRAENKTLRAHKTKDEIKGRKIQKIQQDNLRGGNEGRKREAEERARRAFDRWRSASQRRSQLKDCSSGEQLRKYLKVGKPTDRAARRLRAMLKDGRLEK